MTGRAKTTTIDCSPRMVTAATQHHGAVNHRTCQISECENSKHNCMLDPYNGAGSGVGGPRRGANHDA